MFHAGKTYDFKMNEPSEPGVLAPVAFRAKVIAVDMPLIRVQQGAREVIINTHSQAFIDATRLD